MLQFWRILISSFLFLRLNLLHFIVSTGKSEFKESDKTFESVKHVSTETSVICHQVHYGKAG